MNISGHISAELILKRHSMGSCPSLLCCPALTICSEGTWPFSLVAQVETAKYSYTPRSDFLLLLDGCPFLIFEVCSDRAQEPDRSRMLLQAAVLVRTMNSFRPEQGGSEPFIGVAIYINSKFTAERYLVGQFQPLSSTVRHQCLIVDTLAQIYYFCRSHISRTNSTSRLRVTHFGSFLNFITSPTPYLSITSSLVPHPNYRVCLPKSEMQRYLDSPHGPRKVNPPMLQQTYRMHRRMEHLAMVTPCSLTGYLN